MKIRNILGAMGAAAVLLSLGSPAYASDDQTPPPPPTQEEIASQIAEIETPAVREATQDLYEAILADGREVLAVKTVGFTPAEGEVAARALPSDCGMSVFVSTVGSVVYNDTTTSCGSTFSSVKTHLGIKGENPYNPFDQKTVKDVTFYNYNGTVATRGTSYACQNKNETKWYAISNGELVRGGTTYYTPSVYDVTGNVKCGW